MNASVSPPAEPARPEDDPATILRRVAAAEFGFARDQLTAVDEPGHRIHQCRKAIKRLRAVVGLARDGATENWRRVDRPLRRAGRALSALRDADVVAKTVRHLEASESPMSLDEIIEPTTNDKHLRQRRRKALKQLAKAERRLDRLSLFSADARWSRDELERGLEAAAQRLDGEARRFVEKPNDSNAHELRKSAQQHLAQLRLLEASPDIDNQIAALSMLADELGTHHDLFLLRETLARLRKRIPAGRRRNLRRAAKKMQREIAARTIASLDLAESDQRVTPIAACNFKRSKLRDRSTATESAPIPHGH